MGTALEGTIEVLAQGLNAMIASSGGGLDVMTDAATSPCLREGSPWTLLAPRRKDLALVTELQPEGGNHFDLT